jgi:8-oxo-dGTP pyrophosphatase MutT (NUDIX family)
MSQIRALAVCVFRREDCILVIEANDQVKGETFYRPLGGGIEFGETSLDAVKREIREEIGAEITDLEYLGVLENIFTYDGEPGHEIVQIYDGRFLNDSLYLVAQIQGVESNGVPMTVLWKPLSYFSARHPLYPSGLMNLLQKARHEA